MANKILINYVIVTPSGLVWPGSVFDDADPQFALVVSAGGTFWPASDAIVAAQADLVTRRRLAGVLDLPAAQAMMFGGVADSLANSESALALTADLASTAPGDGTALIGDNQSGGTLASKLNEIGSTSLPTSKTEADATHYGVVKLSTAPAVANTPIAAGINDPAITGAVHISKVQLSQNHPLVAGTVTVATLTFGASAKVVPIRNNPDPVAANWGALSISVQTPGAPGTITCVSSNAADTSSVDLLILDV